MIIWFLILFVDGIDGLPTGAPTTACSTLLPLHSGQTAQTSKAPYQIHAELAGEKIIAHISSSVGEKFEGFLIQARSSKNPREFIDGEFTSSQFSKTINCFNSSQNTLTHVNPDPKMEITTEWTPREPLNEDVIFRATIAKQYDTFWTEVDSNSVTLGNSSAISTAEESSSLPLYENCFKEEGCVGLPSNCIEREDCEVLLKYHESSDGIEFSLEGPLTSSKYMAMALSEDAIMGEDSVTECIRDRNDVIARESWNVGKSNTRTRDLPREQYTGTFVDGLTSCSWVTPLITVSNGQTYDFANKKYYILLATGEVAEWRLKYHTDRLPSSEALNLTEVKGSEENSAHKTTKLQHPPTTPGHEISSTSEKGSSDDKDKTTTDVNRSSCSSMSLVLFIIGLFFAAIENTVYF